MVFTQVNTAEVFTSRLLRKYPVYTCKIRAKVKTGIYLGKYHTGIYLGVFTFSLVPDQQNRLSKNCRTSGPRKVFFLSGKSGLSALAASKISA